MYTGRRGGEHLPEQLSCGGRWCIPFALSGPADFTPEIFDSPDRMAGRLCQCSRDPIDPFLYRPFVQEPWDLCRAVKRGGRVGPRPPRSTTFGRQWLHRRLRERDVWRPFQV